jgi:hypothetical protein
MEVAIIAELSADVVLETFKAQEWNNPADHPGNLTHGQFFCQMMFICYSDHDLQNYTRK